MLIQKGTQSSAGTQPEKEEQEYILQSIEGEDMADTFTSLGLTWSISGEKKIVIKNITTLTRNITGRKVIQVATGTSAYAEYPTEST